MAHVQYTVVSKHTVSGVRLPRYKSQLCQATQVIFTKLFFTIGFLSCNMVGGEWGKKHNFYLIWFLWIKWDDACEGFEW